MKQMSKNNQKQKLNRVLTEEQVRNNNEFLDLMEDWMAKMIDACRRIDMDATDKKVLAMKLQEFVETVDAIKLKHHNLIFGIRDSKGERIEKKEGGEN